MDCQDVKLIGAHEAVDDAVWRLNDLADPADSRIPEPLDQIQGTEPTDPSLR